MNLGILKSNSIKKLVIGFFVVSILLFFSNFNIAKATNSNGQSENSNSVVTIQNNETFPNTLTPQSAIIDNSAMKISISNALGGGITGSWKYTSKVGPVTSVALTMTLEYRKNFLHSWDEVGSVDFIYAGGQGTIEENEHTFYFGTSQEGSYRVKISGTITGTNGFSVISDRVSSTIKGGGSIITRLEQAS